MESKESRESRNKIVQAAVDVITEKTYEAATMREIARKAGVGDAEIFKYFSTKKKLLFAYFEIKQKKCNEIVRGISGFSEYSFQEKLQTFLETLLDLYLPDREFVGAAHNLIFGSLAANYKDLKSIREPFTDVILEFLHAAVVTEEIPEHPLPNAIAHLIFDYFLMVLSYCQNDETAHFSGTTKFIDLSLGMIAAFLKSGIVSGFMDFGIYLFHGQLKKILSEPGGAAERFNALKGELLGFLSKEARGE